MKSKLSTLEAKVILQDLLIGKITKEVGDNNTLRRLKWQRKKDAEKLNNRLNK